MWWNDLISGTDGACHRRDAAAAASNVWTEDRKHPPRSRSLPFDLTNDDGDQLDATHTLDSVQQILRSRRRPRILVSGLES